MILGPVSYLDCIAFLVFLIPQLLLRVNFFTLILVAVKAIPVIGKRDLSLGYALLILHAVLQIPFQFVRERLFTPKPQRSAFVQRSAPFEDFVIRCVRYAFAKITPKVGKVFFSKEVALPFFKFRLWRHDLEECPVPWKEIESSKAGVRGIWIGAEKPDIVVYYCHGGGFSMGSSYFYLEPLIALLTLMQKKYREPAIFALEYTLVPEASYPTQLRETVNGYAYVLSRVSNDATRICLSGDSAGGTLMLSLLLHLSKMETKLQQKPGYAALLSPWVTIYSSEHQNTDSDYLDAEALHLYGRQYAGTDEALDHPIISPGTCRDLEKWKDASPVNGIYITFGSEEVFAPEIKKLVKVMRSAGLSVRVKEEPGGIHAWVITRLFLEESTEDRVHGMKELVRAISDNIPPE